jgi:hypothetical protein
MLLALYGKPIQLLHTKEEPILGFFGFSLSNNLDWKNHVKIKVEKAFFFIFISSFPEMSFWGPKKRKSHLIGKKNPFFMC